MKAINTVGEKMSKNGPTAAIYNSLSFPNSLYVIGGTCQSLGEHARDMRFKYSNLILSKLILLLSLRKQFLSRMDINGQDN